MRKQRAETASYHGKRGSAVNQFLAAAAPVSLVLAALCGFILPGVRFSALLFLGIAALCGALILLNRWAVQSDRGRICRRIVLAGLTVCLVIFLAVESMIVFAGEREPSDEPVAAVIVLGAGVNGTTPSLTLRTRIEAAASYLDEHPDTVAVLSGGQGPGEDITEAQAMYSALTSRGIPAERLLLEERSTNTAENFAFSCDVLAENGIDTAATIAVVTNDFHQFRAQIIARDNGLAVVGIPAELPWWWLNANYYAREFFALGKLWLTTLFG